MFFSRRYFLTLLATPLWAKNCHTENPNIWKMKEINHAIRSLFSPTQCEHIQENHAIMIHTPHASISDTSHVLISIKSAMKDTKRVALLSTQATDESVIAVWDMHSGGLVDFTIEIAIARAGTVFVIIEDGQGALTYAKAYLDVIAMRCG